MKIKKKIYILILFLILIIVILQRLAVSKYVLKKTKDISVFFVSTVVSEESIILNTTEPTNENVEIHITDQSGAQIKYKTNENDEWLNYEQKIIIENNTTIYFQKVFEDGAGEITQKEINNIDKIKPILNNVEITKVGLNYINLNIDATDNEGILDYYYSIDQGTTWTKLEDDWQIKNLEEETTYEIIVKISDKAGNSVTSESLNATTKTAYAQIGKNRYESLTEAIQSVGKDKTTINILKDIHSEEEYEITNDKNIIINLDGKTIECTKSSGNSIMIINNGVLEIIGTGNIKSCSAIEPSFTITNNGDLIIENSKICSESTAINNNGNILIKKGGEIEGKTAVVGNDPTTIDKYEIINTKKDKELVRIMPIPTINLDKTDITNQDINATIELDDSENYIIQYKINDEEWQNYNKTIVLTENCTISTRAQKGDCIGNIVSREVTNIDKIAPDVLLTATSESNSITVNALFEDEGVDETYVPTYNYYLDDELVTTTQDKSYTFSGLDENKEYNIKITANDLAGNEGVRNVTTHTHTDSNICYNGTKHTHTGNSSSGGGCYTTRRYHSHTGSSSSGGGCYTTKNYHSHTGSSSSGGGCYTTKRYHSHTGSSSSGGGCYTVKNYHSHTGSSSSGGGCYTTKNYHSHTSSCYSTVCKGSFSATGNSNSNTVHTCTYTCKGRMSITSSSQNSSGDWVHTIKCASCGYSFLYNSGASQLVIGGYYGDCSQKRTYTVKAYYITYKCSTCSATGQVLQSWSCSKCGASHTASTSSLSHKAVAQYTICGKTTSTVESYSLGCGKTTSTVVSYSLGCGKTTSTVIGYSLGCGKTTSTVESYSLGCGKTTSTVIGYSRSCGKTAGGYYNGSTRVYETCNEVVTSIVPIKQDQSIKKGDQIDTRLMATFLDGHIEIINATTSDYDQTKEYNKSNITLIYTGKIKDVSTTGDINTNITVTTK